MDDIYYLRDYDVEKDINSFHWLRSDPNTMRYFGMNVSTSISESRKLLTDYIEAMKKGECYRKVICQKDGLYIGEIGINKINKEHHRANAFSILLPQYRHRGISIYIANSFYNYVFKSLDINRVQALVDTRNLDAKKSLSNIGYQYEGTLYQYELESDGFVDLDVYALLKKDYIGL
jgi:ribosomal-protein-alanine N-acetyltransferase